MNRLACHNLVNELTKVRSLLNEKIRENEALKHQLFLKTNYIKQQDHALKFLNALLIEVPPTHCTNKQAAQQLPSYLL